MNALEKRMFWEELDATSESFVRRKLACGGYNAAESAVAAEWLKVRDTIRSERNSRIGARAAMQGAFWTKAAAIASGLGVLVALVTLLK